MDDPDTLPGGMPSDGLDVGDAHQRAGTVPVLVADENENRLEATTSEEGVMVELEQDSVNNNEGCNHNDDGSPSHEMAGAGTDPGEEPRAAKAKCASEKASPGCNACVNGAPTGISPTENAQFMSGDIPADSLQDINLEPHANHQLREGKQRLQSLFSVIREEFQQHEVASLPRCLHQIAETYFQEEEYEKAMQFIQLERLYHEQLLANLSAIQEQWESKWKKMAPEKMVSRSSEKGLNREELERLASLCASHQEPCASKQKLLIPEKFIIGGTDNSIRPEELQKAVVAACKSDRESWPGVELRRESQEEAEERSASSADSLTEDRSLRAVPEHEHMEETYCNDESTLESHTYSPEPVGRPRSDCLSSGDVRNDTSCLLLAGTQSHKDGTDRAEASKEPQSKVPVEDVLVSSPESHSEPTNGFLQAGNSLRLEHCVDSPETATSAFGINMLGQQPSGPSGEDREQSTPVRTEPCVTVCNDKAFRDSNASLPESVERESGDQVTDDMTEVLSNEETRDNERSDMGLDCYSNNSENLPDEEVSYSTEEAVLEDSSISLDELAKRIEVEEIVPAEGLVSILKKQNESEGKKHEQITQKPAKRRVRFQEMDDALDQEDLGGGSCFVLILLCVTTVFLSIVGTALYCTLGYVDSPVCTDFADNMDFYYTHLLQGVDELKHWFSFS